jgi:hypothetical protein
LKEPDFAFIHDSLEIRYKVLTDCNFTEVGSEYFAVQPFSVAVQKGSSINEELSRRFRYIPPPLIRHLETLI